MLLRARPTSFEEPPVKRKPVNPSRPPQHRLSVETRDFSGRVDPTEVASIVAEVVSVQNGWKVILARCAPTTKPRSAKQLARGLLAARDLEPVEDKTP